MSFQQFQSPMMGSSSNIPVVIDIESPCTWEQMKYGFRKTPPYFNKKQLYERVLLPEPHSILDQMRKDLRMNLNVYYAVVGFRLGSGKSDTDLRIAKYLDPEWSIENCYVDSVESFARLVERRRDHFTVAWDEPQKVMNAVDWSSIPDELRDFMIEQRENQIGIGLATPDLEGIWYVVRRLLNYVFEIKARDSQHVHGLIWERRGNPMHSDEFAVTGTFTFPKPTDPYLVSELAKYHAAPKRDHMNQGREDFIVRALHGGRAKELVKEYVTWLQAKGVQGRAKKDFIRIWSYETEQELSQSEREEIWGEYSLLLNTGELDVEVKPHGKRKH